MVFLRVASFFSAEDQRLLNNFKTDKSMQRQRNLLWNCTSRCGFISAPVKKKELCCQRLAPLQNFLPRSCDDWWVTQTCYTHRCNTASARKIKSFIILAVYAEACNEFVGHISASLRPGNTAPFEENVPAVAGRWQHCVRFDRPEIWTSDLPLQRRTHRITARPTGRCALCKEGFFLKQN